MKFQNMKKDGFSIIEVMVSFVIVLSDVFLIDPNLFSTYEISKEMSKVRDVNAIIDTVNMRNFNLFIEGEGELSYETASMEEFKKINDNKKYLNSWPKWIKDSMIIKNIRYMCNRSEIYEIISKDLVFRV